MATHRKTYLQILQEGKLPKSYSSLVPPSAAGATPGRPRSVGKYRGDPSKTS